MRKLALAALLSLGFSTPAYAHHCKGGHASDPACAGGAAGSKTVFVTSLTFPADLKRFSHAGLSALRGADDICQAAAEHGVVPIGHYIAWLSTPFKDAIDRLPPNTSGYFLPSGVKVADDNSDLVSCDAGVCEVVPENRTGV